MVDVLSNSHREREDLVAAVFVGHFVVVFNNDGLVELARRQN